MLFDAHCHIQDLRLAANVETTLSRAFHAGISKMMCCGTSEEDWPRLADLARAHDEIMPSFGLHPWFIGQRSSRWLTTLKRFLDTSGGAVGEIGLDHGIKDRRDEEQESVFLEQLAVAKERKLPVSIHCRRAFVRLIELLEEVGPPSAGFVIHSFSGTKEDIPRLVDLGAFFSFSGTVTLHRNKRAHRNVLRVPIERLLIETDAPDMMPLIPGKERECRPTTGPRPINEPVNLLYVRDKVAELLSATKEETNTLTFENATRLFLLNPPRQVLR